MATKIDEMILDNAEHGVPALFVDFRGDTPGKLSYVDCIDIPNEVPYEINIQVTNEGEITALDIFDFYVFMDHIDQDSYLPDLGNFSYKQFEDMSLKEMLKRIFNQKVLDAIK